MTALPVCDELRHSVNSPDWEPRFIYYCERAKLDDIRLARQINAPKDGRVYERDAGKRYFESDEVADTWKGV
ncbi:hypothetical protein Tco_0112200 [Tanacetum coccineum]